jgi:glutaminyl-tRNA synthetase
MENPPKKFFRLTVGSEVRLRYSYIIKCQEVIKDQNGNIIELRCTHDPMSGNGSSSDGRKIKGVIHWVNAADALPVEVRLYDRLFSKEAPDNTEEGKTFIDYLNPESLKVITAMAEPSMAHISAGDKFQFERMGYFVADYDSTPGKPIFNRTVTLKDSWSKEAKK